MSAQERTLFRTSLRFMSLPQMVGDPNRYYNHNALLQVTTTQVIIYGSTIRNPTIQYAVGESGDRTIDIRSIHYLDAKESYGEYGHSMTIGYEQPKEDFCHLSFNTPQDLFQARDVINAAQNVLRRRK
jgi:hypothetical protein